MRHDHRHAPSGGHLTIVCGLPGSGKTTVAHALAEQGGELRLCPDEWMDRLELSLWDQLARARIETLQWAVAQVVLAQGGRVIIEWGTWARAERDLLRSRARALGAGVSLIYAAAPLEVLIARISRRGREDPAITFSELQEWAAHFEVPGVEEQALYDEFRMVSPAG